MQLDEIQAIFFQECEEGLAAIETHLAEMRDAAPKAETIDTIFRAVVAIKGGAGAFGFDRLQGFSHHLKTVLDMLRTGEASPSPDIVALLFAAFDVLSDHVASAQRGSAAPADGAVAADRPAAVPGHIDDDPAAMDFDLDAMLAGIDLPGVAAAPWHVVFCPSRAAFDNGDDPLPLLRELETMGATILSLDLAGLPGLDRLAVDECCLGGPLTVPAVVARDEIAAVFDFLPDDAVVAITAGEVDPVATPADLAPAGVAPAEPVPAVEVLPVVAEVDPPAMPATAAPDDAGGKMPGSATIRVEPETLDRLVNLVGERVITQAMLAQRLSLHGVGTIDELSDLDHLTRDLQESAMSIRAQPVKSVFSRVPRIIRELEAGTGRRVRLAVEGEMTEVDKTVVERIGEPLTHMIRNAVDHGLESPDERVAAGKPAEGVVRLVAEHRSGRIVIPVSNDGRGIVAADAHLSNEEIGNPIFAPRFSTAATVSNISGRSVGMDVVRRNGQALGGRIGIASTPGRGPTFTPTWPLTLAILDGMVVAVGSQTYVIPPAHVVESLRPQPGEVRPPCGGAEGDALTGIRLDSMRRRTSHVEC